MTIQAATARVALLCNGATTLFPVNIQAYNASDFLILATNTTGATLAGIGAGASIVLTLNSDYTMAASGTLAPPFWALTSTIVYPTGINLLAILNPTETHLTQYPQGQTFPSLAVQTDFDRLTQMVIRLSDQMGRTIRQPDGDVTSWNALLSATARANTLQGYDASGNPTIAPSLATVLTQAAFNALLNASPPYIQTPAELAAGVTPVNFGYPSLTVDRYATNTTPGTTDMTVAIKSAWKVAVAQGGGVITFIKGATYAMTSLDATNPSVNLANQNSNGSISGTPFQIQMYCLGGSNITFDFAGALLKSTLTGGGVGFLLDNCTNIDFKKPNFLGTQVQGGGVVSLGAVTPGAGYVNGTYTNVLMTGGTGQGCACTITVTGGAVTSCVPTYAGGSSTASLAQGYQIGDVLSTSNANLGGAGAGFSVPVTNSLGAGNVVSVASILPICVTSNSGLSSGITTYDLTATKCFLGFACIDGLNVNGIVSNNISLLGHTVVNGGSEYGISLNNGGDGTFIENLYTFQVNRPFFFYGCQGATVARLTAEQTNYGFGSIIKSYSRSTSGISVNALHRNAAGNPTVHISIQVQCDPAVINPPPTVKNVYIKHDDFNVKQSNAVEFDYFAGAGGTVQTATSALQLFDQIWLQGITAGVVISTVRMTTAAAQCQINYDNLEAAWSVILGSPTDIRNGLGFIASRAFFCNLALTFGGTVVAGTGGFVQCFIADGFCKVKGTMTLTAKNGAGQAAITLPFSSRLDDTTQTLGLVLGVANMAALGGAMIGALGPNSNSMLLYTHAATASQSVLDTNFTATSSLYFDITYPI